MTLEQIIIQEIRQNGPISFRDFMETALYHPNLGYYNSQQQRIGVEGDFYTSCTHTPGFGSLLARQLAEMYELLNTLHFIIVEYGAGTGNLCRDIIDEIQQSYPVLYDKLRYCIIEKSEYMREKEKEFLTEKVSWYNCIQEVGPFTGCVISNELVDNFSVHEVVMQDELMEIFVGYENGFIEILKPAPKILFDYLEELKVQLPRNFRTEINMEATNWMEDIASTLTKGFLLTIDYGFSSTGLYSENRCDGTIVCYHRHKVNYCPFKNIGEQDITAHVNFSALCHWGEKNGLRFQGFTNQACFLLALGLGNDPTTKIGNANTTQFLRDYLFEMGRKLKVLILQKGIEKTTLSGLRIPLPLI
jgi:SAM-dependent MidA family methyltransferase